MIFGIILAISSNIISYYKASDIKIADEVCSDGSDIVHFWATWCPTCKLESDNIQTLSEHFEVLSIAVKSGSKNDLKIYMKEHNLNYRVYNDENAQLASKFNISVYPTTFIYNSEKKLVFSEVGYTSTFGLWLRMWWAS